MRNESERRQTTSVTQTIALGTNSRPGSIRLIPGSNLAVIAERTVSGGGDGLIVNLSSGAFATIPVNAALSGGSSDVAINGSTAYFADQASATVSYVPVSTATGQPTGSPANISVDLGPRALAIDTRDNPLLVTCEGSGTVVLADLTTRSWGASKRDRAAIKVTAAVTETATATATATVKAVSDNGILRSRVDLQRHESADSPVAHRYRY